MAELVVGVDMGTGSTKGVLATPDGTIVATASRTHAMSLPRPGWAEMDAETDWWGDVVAVLRELIPQAGDARIAGVCVSGLGPCLLVCDEAVRPLRAGILYGIDMRATAEIEELTRRFGADAILARCGKALSTQAVGPKLAWIRANEPAVWERTRRWYSAHSFVVARMTGEYVLDHHTASQTRSTTCTRGVGRPTGRRRSRRGSSCRGSRGPGRPSGRSARVPPSRRASPRGRR
jgi:xylulokinase